MSKNVQNLQKVKMFLEATTPDDLVAFQLENNLVNGKMFGYTAPVVFGDKLIVWFDADLEDYERIQ